VTTRPSNDEAMGHVVETDRVVSPDVGVQRTAANGAEATV
jgi:hypothetical protein